MDKLGLQVCSSLPSAICSLGDPDHLSGHHQATLPAGRQVHPCDLSAKRDNDYHQLLRFHTITDLSYRWLKHRSLLARYLQCCSNSNSDASREWGSMPSMGHQKLAGPGLKTTSEMMGKSRLESHSFAAITETSTGLNLAYAGKMDLHESLC